MADNEDPENSRKPTGNPFFLTGKEDIGRIITAWLESVKEILKNSPLQHIDKIKLNVLTPGFKRHMNAMNKAENDLKKAQTPQTADKPLSDTPKNPGEKPKA